MCIVKQIINHCWGQHSFESKCLPILNKKSEYNNSRYSGSFPGKLFSNIPESLENMSTYTVSVFWSLEKLYIYAVAYGLYIYAAAYTVYIFLFQ